MTKDTVTVVGTAAIPTEPDEVELVLELTHLAETPDAALEDVAGRSDGLRALLDELGVPRAARATQGATLAEETEHVEGRAGSTAASES